MGSLGFSPPETYGQIAAYNELVSGGLIVLGAFGPVGPALMISNMIVAASTVHAPNGFFAQKNGYELPALYAASALSLASSGYGAVSFDKITGLDKVFAKSGRTFWAVALGVAGAAIALAQRDVADDSSTPAASAPAEPSASPAQNGAAAATDDLGSKA
jgi:putative oxidoreductase